LSLKKVLIAMMMPVLVSHCNEKKKFEEA